jgi:hypothetical protein
MLRLRAPRALLLAGSAWISLAWAAFGLAAEPAPIEVKVVVTMFEISADTGDTPASSNSGTSARSWMSASPSPT